MRSEPQSEAGIQHVWYVLVQDAVVVGWYTQREIGHRDNAVACWRRTRNRPVRIYEVDANLSLPPTVGTQVDPVQLGWAEIAV